MALRWSDLDVVDHVTNSRYIEFSREAFASRAYSPFPGSAISRCAITYRTPVRLADGAITVYTEYGEHVAHQRFMIGRGEPRAAAKLSASWLEPTAAPIPEARPDISHQVEPRAGDCFDGQLDFVAQFDLFQEGRNRLFDTVRALNPHALFALAQVEVEFHRPMPWSPEPTLVELWFTGLGTSSSSACGQLMRDGVVYSTMQGTQVSFDKTSQRSRPLSEAERGHIEACIASRLDVGPAKEL